MFIFRLALLVFSMLIIELPTFLSSTSTLASSIEPTSTSTTTSSSVSALISTSFVSSQTTTTTTSTTSTTVSTETTTTASSTTTSTAVPVPSTPECSSVTAVSNSSLKAYWRDGGNATDFRIHVGERNQNFSISRNSTCLNLSQECSDIITGLSPGTNYSIKIFALAYGIENNESCPLTGNTMPSTPECSSVTAVSNSSLKAYWRDGGNATDFRIHVGERNQNFSISRNSTCLNLSQECSDIITGLSPGTNYSIKIFARAYGIENNESCPLTGNTMPSTPECSSVTAVSNSSLKAYWRDGGNATDFRIHVGERNQNFSISKISTCLNLSQECSDIITGLSPGTNYSIKIFARAYGIENNESCPLTGNTMPSTPECSSVTAVSNSSLKAYWRDGGNATDFRIHVGERNQNFSISRNSTCLNLSQECSDIITGLSPGTNYSIKIFARAYGIENNESCPLTGNTMPSTPECSSVTAVSNSSLKAYWRDGGNATDFRIHVGERNQNFSISKISTCLNLSQACSDIITGLSPGTNYSIKIFARAYGIENNESCPLTGNTMPSTPECSSVTAVSNSSLKAYWRDGGNATDFRIHVGERNQNFSISRNSTCLNLSQACSDIITGLSPGTNYSIKIFARAYGIENNESCPLTGNTMPSTPECSSVTAVSNSSLKAYWRDGGNATDFRIHVGERNQNFSISKISTCLNLSQACSDIITGLSPGTNYSIKIFARAYGIENNESCPLTGNTMPSTPECSSVTAVSNSSLKAYWRDGGNATDFRIHVGERNQNFSISRNSTCLNLSQACSDIITGLSPGTNYSIKIFARAYGIENNESCPLTGNTMPSTPECSSVTAVSNSSLKAYWRDGGNATDFRIHVGERNQNFSISKISTCLNLSQACSDIITGLSPGTNYSIKIFARAYGIENNESCPLTGNTMPSTPECSSVTAVSNSSLKAYWRDGGNATDFRIHVGERNQNFSISRNSTCLNLSQACSDIITGLSPGTNYSIKIFARAYGIENNESCPLTGNTMPSTPECSSVTAVSNSSLKAYWRDGGNATDFRIHVGERNQNFSISKISTCLNLSQACSDIITGLSPGTNYSIKIFARAYGIENNESCPLTGNTMPSTPECSSVTAVSNSSLKAYWRDGGNATDFRIHVGERNQNFSISRNSTCLNLSQECSDIITGLSPGTNYSIKIFARAYGIENNESCPLTGNTMPSTPECSSVTAVSNSSLKAYWRDGGNATDFRIHVGERNQNFSISKISTCLNLSQACSDIITGLSPGTNYSIKIFARAYGIENNESCPLTGNTMPSTPECSSVTAVSNSSLKAYWRDGGNATDFRIHVGERNQNFSISKISTCLNLSQACSDIITGLSPGTNYSIKIFARAYGIENNESCPLTGNTMPSTPECSSVTAVSNSSLKAYWRDGGNATDFRIHVGERNQNFSISRNSTCLNLSQECSDIITGLSPGTNYSIKIFARAYGIENNESCPLTENTMPSIPQCFYVTAVSNSSLKVYWRDGGNATDFQIHVGEQNRDFSISKNSTCLNLSQECSHIITGLIPGRKYNISIFALAYGVENNQSCSLIGNAIPSKPIECAVLERTSHNFTITWNNDTGDRDFYKVNYSCWSPNKLNETWKDSMDLWSEEKIYKSIHLDPGTYCELQIYAGVRETNTLSLPLVCNLTTNETAPGNVDNLYISNITSTSMIINWSPPSERNGKIRGYHLTVIENKGYCVEKESCVQHYDFSIDLETGRDYICQDIENLTEIAGCLRSNTMSNTGSFALEKLKPHVNYSICLRAYTLCSGHKVVKTVTTLSADPHQPSNINATAIAPKNITVTWQSPDLCTGMTSYSVIYTDAISNMGTFNASCDSRKDFQLTECTIGGLEEYWQYNIKVMATVQGFSSNISSSINATTLESTPGPLETLELTPENNLNHSRAILVRWSPPTARERNGVILFYKIAYYHNLSDVIEIVLGPNELQTRLEHLLAERIYFVNISANTSKGYGETVQKNTTIRSGAPDPPTQPLFKSTAQVPDPKRQIAVDLPVSAFLCNTSFGFPELWGVVVSQYSKATGSFTTGNFPKDDSFRGNASDFQTKLKSKYKSWRDIRNEDNFPPYRATHDEWKPVESCASPARRSTESENGPDFVSFLIGQDADCAGSGQHFCNGYLKPNTDYSVRVYVCTSEGCTESMWSPPIKTDNDYTAVIIAVSVVLSLLLLLGIGVAIVLRMRRMMCFKGYKIEEPGPVIVDPINWKIKVHRPIKLCDLRMHVEQMHKDSNIGFSSEYKCMKEIEPKHTTEVAESESCRSKNRYTNILPYDHSRVKLLPIDNEEGSDYINANYIQGYNSKREYIATQGPLPGTRDDFWRMIWEQSAEIIVMLTKCTEKGKVKCDKYWPDVKEPVYYGDLTVDVISESILSDYIIRVIQLELTQTTKKVYHFSFLNWPDMGCPKDPAALLNFVTSVRTYVKPNFQSPIVVHCSAGVGRTGTYIAIDHLMQRVRDSVEIDIFNLVYEMRNQRCNMVQTEDQYVFIHDSILEFITEDDDAEEEEPIYQNKPMDDDNVYENTAFIQ